MKWTEEQSKAIDIRGKNLLVAAAAGSGKTAVLVERIFKIITEDTDVNKLLVVTFTNAAAKEMSVRLYSKLSEALQEEGISDSRKERLTRQIILLSSANITTIHSFCQKIIKNNFKESGVDPACTVVEDKENEVIKQECLEKVLGSYYEDFSPGFIRLLDTYGRYKSDDALRDTVFKIVDIANSCVDPCKWLREQADVYDYTKYEDFTCTKWAKDIIDNLISGVDAYCEEYIRLRDFASCNGGEFYSKTLDSDYNNLKNFAVILNKKDVKWQELYDVAHGISFMTAPSMTAKVKAQMLDSEIEACAQIKEKRDKIKKKVNDLVNNQFGNSPDMPVKEMNLLYEDMKLLSKISVEFIEEHRKEKKKRNYIDFNDFEHMAYNTLKDNPDIVQYYKDLFEEIYIDEYQDTSEIQEAILTAVSREQKNMFMVGDVKQSIYSFRQARPDIFLEKYKKYAARNDEYGTLLLLNKNFRSSKGVIDSVNHVFAGIMNERTCSMDYTEKESLNYGAEGFDVKKESNAVECHVIDKNAEITEPEFVAERIKKLVDNKYKVLNLKTGELSEVKYSDIVILLRSFSKKAHLYAKALSKAGIPAYYHVDGGFFDCGEINVLMSFLRIIDNPLQDMHFISVMRNIYGFTDEELAQISIHYRQKLPEGIIEKGRQYFYDACIDYTGDDKQNVKADISDKLNAFINRYNNIRTRADAMAISQLLWILIHENNFYDVLLSQPDGPDYRGNINLLLNNAMNYDKNTGKGLFGFILYYDNLRKRKVDLNSANSMSGANQVNIMSIHKSKGLEFPVVFLSDTGKRFNMKDLDTKMVVHSYLGYGPTCYEKNKKITYSSIMRECIKLRCSKDYRAEEMRVLYVAMTRAKDKLIITGKTHMTYEEFSQKSLEKRSLISQKPINYYVLNAASYLEWIAMHYCQRKDQDKDVIRPVPASELYKQTRPEEAKDDKSEDDDETETFQEISFLPRMPAYSGENKVDKTVEYNKFPAKISVTEIKRLIEAFEDENTVRYPEPDYKMNELPDFSQQRKEGISAKNQGTLLHLCLQKMDYAVVERVRISEKPNQTASAYIDELIMELEDEDIISDEESKLLRRDILIRFLLSDFAKRLSAADKMVREKPFIMNSVLNGQNVTIQGIIDCVIEEKGVITLVDFKSDYVGDNPSNEELYKHSLGYSVQLTEYAKCLRLLTGAEPKKLLYYLRYNKEIEL